ncbi:MAG: N-acetylmuramoyl-L-alanine amidase [Candidatus Korobacteraceae bacterium]
MRILSRRRLYKAAVAVLVLMSALGAPAHDSQHNRQLAHTQFETAEHMREALNRKPAGQRTRREYQQVIDAYRRVYLLSPGSSKADISAFTAADLLVEQGRGLRDEKPLHAAISQYEFLRHEYPGSKYCYEALFLIGQVYKEDLQDLAKARQIFQEFLKHYPRQRLAEEARNSIQQIDDASSRRSNRAQQLPAPLQGAQERPSPLEFAEWKQVADARSLPLVTGIRHWSTPGYTRVAIDLEAEVPYEAGRAPNPDRIFFDLHGTRLASELAGKSFDVDDGFLRKIRAGQYQRDMSRVVLEVDDVSDYSVFLLPNPYRLIIDIHGRKPGTAIATTEAAANRKAEAARTADAGKTSPQPQNQRPAANATGQESAKPAGVDKNEAQKATSQPTTKPTFQAVAPRPPEKRQLITPPVRPAQPSSDGERSLIRALGLKIGRIVVDAGHGGYDTGTIGPNGLQEKDLVLDVSLRLGRLLKSRLGAEVVYTRTDDSFVPLETRTAIANQQQADLFISVHANSSADRRARGVETYYLNFTSSSAALEVAARENAVSEKSIHELQDLVKKIALRNKIEESREFAVDVQSSLQQTLSRGVRDRGVKKAPFIVLIGANMPSVLAEIAFVSNPAEARKLQTPEYRQRIAEALYKGVTKYASGLSGVKMASRVSPRSE